MNRRGQVGLAGIAIAAIVLVCTVVIGLYIAAQVESSMNLTGTNWATPYSNFVTSVQTGFTLLGVAFMVIIAAYMLRILMGLAGGGSRQ